MLSAESAAGKYPVESVTMQQRIINRVEADYVYRSSLDEYAKHAVTDVNNVNDAITLAARQV
jgi:pyruvate kinase